MGSRQWAMGSGQCAMDIMRNVIAFGLFLPLISEYALSQDIGIIFPEHPLPRPPPPPVPRIGKPCIHHSGVGGVCRPLLRCREVRNKVNRRKVTLDDVICPSRRPLRNALVCCLPNFGIGKNEDISPPEGIYEKCGQTWYDSGSINLMDLYNGNKTADEFIEKGFAVTVRNMSQDHVTEFYYTNDSHSGTWIYRPRYYTVGSVNARRVLTVYMALLGSPERWFCDGVLINSQWVLTAAHCFDFGGPTVVRLGEYDHSDETLKRNEVPLDFSISETLIHPEYKSQSSYHDLALVKLNKPIPQLRPDLKPICLPWGEESLKDLVGEVVTLTGWGATSFAGPSSPILQEVNITVFDPSVCDRSYSTLPGYEISFPNGIRKETSVCAGDEQGGKDACQGDSGGPIVYLDNSNRYTLAGIVSTGHGCGLKEFPGIYAPLHNTNYLSWIKQTAFK